MYDPYKDFVSFELSNGIKVWKLPMEGRPWEKARVVVHTGHSTDPVGKEGLAHFCEHLASEQYREPQDSEILRRKFESFGGSASFGVTTPVATFYDFSIPLSVLGIDTLSWAFDSYAEILTKLSGLTASEIRHVEKERSIIVSEFHKKYGLSWSYPVTKTLREHVYPGLWQSRVINGLGSLETIGGFTPEDVVELYKESYVPTNMTIISVGGASIERLTEVLEQAFGRMKSGPKTRPDTQALKLGDVPKPLVSKIVVPVESQKQSDVQVLNLIPSTTPWPVTSVLRRMMRRALYEDIREAQHLAYSVSFSSLHYPNAVEMQMFAKAIHPSAVEKVEKAFLDALASVVSDSALFTEEYNAQLASYAMLDVSGGGLCDSAYSNIANWGTVTTTEEDYQEFTTVTHKAVSSLVDQWFEPRRLYTIVYQP